MTDNERLRAIEQLVNSHEAEIKLIRGALKNLKDAIELQQAHIRELFAKVRKGQDKGGTKWIN